MPPSWSQVYRQLEAATKGQPRDTVFFRGHADANWKLLPGLARGRIKSKNAEEVLYFEFLTRAGDLLPANCGPWNVAFAMQHHGLPTRLLDWTETLAVAVYFAVRDGEGDAAIWILDPFELNRRTLNDPSVLHPTDMHGDYEEYFVERTKTLEGNVVALAPLRHNPRVFHQRAGFTLHDNLTAPLEELHPDVVKRIIIPATARAGAKRFLQLAGVSEFSLFPDLDGLSREIQRQFLGS